VASKTKPAKPSPVHNPPADIYQAVALPLQALQDQEAWLARLYGLGRILRFAGPELAAKLGKAKDRLGDAIRLNDQAKAETELANVAKGWKVLEARALENGLTALRPDIIATIYKGREVYVVTGPAEAYDKAREELPEDARVVHVGELLAAFDIVRDKIEGVRKAFPGARLVGELKPEGDEIPF
jgi:hypothetical protein